MMLSKTKVHKYKYLGSWIYEDGRCLEEIKCRIGQAKMSFLENKELLRSNINITVKKKIIETHIFSVLAYGVSWPSGLAYRTQVLVLATECGFESRP